MSPSSPPSALGAGGLASPARGGYSFSLRAAGAFSRKFGGYSDKGAFCLSSYNTLIRSMSEGCQSAGPRGDSEEPRSSEQVLTEN